MTTTINNLQIARSQGINSLSKSSSRFKPTIGNDGILHLFSSGKKLIKSCTSLNPGYPDSDNHNKQSPNSEKEKVTLWFIDLWWGNRLVKLSESGCTVTERSRSTGLEDLQDDKIDHC